MRLHNYNVVSRLHRAHLAELPDWRIWKGVRNWSCFEYDTVFCSQILKVCANLRIAPVRIMLVFTPARLEDDGPRGVSEAIQLQENNRGAKTMPTVAIIKSNGERRECKALAAETKEEIVLESGIVLSLALLAGIVVIDRIAKGRHARRNDDLRLHIIKMEDRRN